MWLTRFQSTAAASGEREGLERGVAHQVAISRRHVVRLTAQECIRSMHHPGRITLVSPGTAFRQFWLYPRGVPQSTVSHIQRAFSFGGVVRLQMPLGYKYQYCSGGENISISVKP